MEQIIDKKFDEFKIYIKGEMDHYLGLQREGFREDLKIVIDSVTALTDRFDRLEMKVLQHDELLSRHSRDIVVLKSK